MAWAKIADQCLWLKHSESGGLRTILQELPPGAPIRLAVDSDIIDFKKMASGRDGRETKGLVPFGGSAVLWKNRYVPGEHEKIWLEIPEKANG